MWKKLKMTDNDEITLKHMTVEQYKNSICTPIKSGMQFSEVNIDTTKELNMEAALTGRSHRGR